MISASIAGALLLPGSQLAYTLYVNSSAGAAVRTKSGSVTVEPDQNIPANTVISADPIDCDVPPGNYTAEVRFAEVPKDQCGAPLIDFALSRTTKEAFAVTGTSLASTTSFDAVPLKNSKVIQCVPDVRDLNGEAARCQAMPCHAIV